MTSGITFEIEDFDKLVDLLDSYFCCENDNDIKITKENNTYYVSILLET